MTQGGQTTTLTYDADGQRVVQETMTATIVYVGSLYEVRFEKQNIAQDLDGDCDVDVADIMLVAACWRCQCEDDCYDSRYDFELDCDIDIVDIMKVVAHWGETCEQLAETVKYYTLGGKRVAMRKEPVGEPDTLYYLFSDHLGSSSVAYDTSNNTWTTQRYYPWGTIRPGPDNALPTDYTFTGQKLDESTGLMYYGARYYDAALGRFVQADTIVPNPANPQDLNRYAYVRNNPLRYTDPSGYIAENEVERALGIIGLLQRDYRITIRVDFGWHPVPHPAPGEPGQVWIEGAWELSEMETVLLAVRALAGAMGGSERFRENLGGVRIARQEMQHAGLARAHRVWLNAAGFSQWTVVHELGHAWDAAQGWRLSREMQRAMGAGFAHPIRHFFDRDNPDYWYDPGQGPPPCGVDENFNRKEDFAEAVTAYIYSDEAQWRASSRGWPYHDPQRGYDYAHFHDTPRGQYISALMVARP